VIWILLSYDVTSVGFGQCPIGIIGHWTSNGQLDIYPNPIGQCPYCPNLIIQK